MGDGFEVDPARLTAIMGVIHGAADDLRSVRGDWDSKARNGATAFGTAECGEAFRSLHDNTFDSLGKHVQHLTRIGDAVGGSAALYAGIDLANSQSLGGA